MIKIQKPKFGKLEFVIYPSTWLRMVSPSAQLRTASLSSGLSNHLSFGACHLLFPVYPDWVSLSRMCFNIGLQIFVYITID